MENILLVRNLSKRFGKAEPLNSVSFDIRKGEIFGILGPNGAGKTTLLRCLLGLLAPCAGTIEFKKEPLNQRHIHRNFSYLPEEFHPPLNLSGLEFLNFLSKAFCSPLSVEECLKKAGLFKDKDKKIRDYSRGMLQRLGLALILLKNADVAILDEPILGLDLSGQNQAFGIIKELSEGGKTVIFSSHLLFHIEKYCHRIGIIHEGKLKFTGGVEEFMNRHKSDSFEQAFLRETEP